jgi:hypothetical protein
MAKVLLNSLFNGVSGKMGDVVFKQTSTGKTIIALAPAKSNRKPSEAQKAQRERFIQATAYAKAALADPTARLHYEAEAARLLKPAYSLAVADYFKGINLLEK